MCASSWKAVLVAVMSMLAASVLADPNEDAQAKRAPEMVVSDLYRAYAWEAVFSKASYTPLVFQSWSELSKYFSRGLADKLSADRDCRISTKEVCRLDFHPIYASQDPSILYDLKIARRTDVYVQAEFKNAVAKPPVRIEFKMIFTSDGWRIDDIGYGDGFTLRGVLQGGE